MLGQCLLITPGRLCVRHSYALSARAILTWNERRTPLFCLVFVFEKSLALLPRVCIGKYNTRFWRYQNAKIASEEFLSSIEAVRCFFVEAESLISWENQTMERAASRGCGDQLLYFFAWQWLCIYRAWRKQEVRWCKGLEDLPRGSPQRTALRDLGDSQSEQGEIRPGEKHSISSNR